MAQEIEAYTKSALILEVQKFQIEAMENLLKQNDVTIPYEMNQLIGDLEQIKNIEEDANNVLSEEDHQYFGEIDISNVQHTSGTGN